jgi:hypothetical protein
LERCTVAALVEAHKVINRPKAKTDRIIFIPFSLPTEPVPPKDQRTGYRCGLRGATSSGGVTISNRALLNWPKPRRTRPSALHIRAPDHQHVALQGVVDVADDHGGTLRRSISASMVSNTISTGIKVSVTHQMIPSRAAIR